MFTNTNLSSQIGIHSEKERRYGGEQFNARKIGMYGGSDARHRQGETTELFLQMKFLPYYLHFVRVRVLVLVFVLV